jgi:hypothetical protein
MVDLVVARTLRILALTPASNLWQSWIIGHEKVLKLLESGDRPGAVSRYRQIYVDFRAEVEAHLFE